MDFNFTSEQERLRKSARDFLKTECPSSFVLEMEADKTGYSPELWRKMQELDWMALIIPEQYDGVGGEFLDLMIMLEEMGRACTPGPFFSTIVLGGLSIMDWGNESQKKRFLPGIANGEIKITLADSEPETTRYSPYPISTVVTVQDTGYTINGTKLFVQDAEVADYMLVSTRTFDSGSIRDGISLFIVDAKSPGISLTPLQTIGGDKQYEVVFDEVKVLEADILGGVYDGGRQLDSILQKATVCKCAEMVGGGQMVLEMATEYAKERKQFGKPIGAYQAIQHHCANMLIDVESSRFITYKTAWMVSQNLPCVKQVAITKAWVSDRYKNVAGLGHQVQGAAAYIIEHAMPLYSRRASASAVAFEDSNYCRQVVASELGI